MKDYLYGLFLILVETLRSIWRGRVVRWIVWLGVLAVAFELVWEMAKLREESAQLGLTSFFFLAAIPVVIWAGRYLVLASRDAADAAASNLSKVPRFTRIQAEPARSRVKGQGSRGKV